MGQPWYQCTALESDLAAPKGENCWKLTPQSWSSAAVPLTGGRATVRVAGKQHLTWSQGTRTPGPPLLPTGCEVLPRPFHPWTHFLHLPTAARTRGSLEFPTLPGTQDATTAFSYAGKPRAACLLKERPSSRGPPSPLTLPALPSGGPGWHACRAEFMASASCPRRKARGSRPWPRAL